MQAAFVSCYYMSAGDAEPGIVNEHARVLVLTLFTLRQCDRKMCNPCSVQGDIC